MELMLTIVCVILLSIMNVETRTVTSQFKFTKMMVKSRETKEKDRVVKCSELPAPVLNDILGAAFNSRYK